MFNDGLTIRDTWYRGLVDVVLDGGGAKGPSLIGFLKAILEREIQIGDLTCASIGTTVGGLFTNGFEPDEILDIYMQEFARFDKKSFVRALWPPHPLRILRDGGIADLRPLFTSLVSNYGLRPQPNLKIVAARIGWPLIPQPNWPYIPARTGWGLHPYLFQGLDYDLATAMNASCAMPPYIKSVWVQHGEQRLRLLDGGLWHTTPYHFCTRPAIVSRLGMASRRPTHKLSFLDQVIHYGEMLIARPIQNLYVGPVRPEQHLVIRTGDPTVATFTVGLTEALCRQMFITGRDNTRRALDKLEKDSPRQSGVL